jgi:hypothetical protein
LLSNEKKNKQKGMKKGFASLFNFTPEPVVIYSRNTGSIVVTIPPEIKTIYRSQAPQVVLGTLNSVPILSPAQYTTSLNYTPPADASVIVTPEVAPLLANHCKNVFCIDASRSGGVRSPKSGRLIGTYNLIKF